MVSFGVCGWVTCDYQGQVVGYSGAENQSCSGSPETHFCAKSIDIRSFSSTPPLAANLLNFSFETEYGVLDRKLFSLMKRIRISGNQSDGASSDINQNVTQNHPKHISASTFSKFDEIIFKVPFWQLWELIW